MLIIKNMDMPIWWVIHGGTIEKLLKEILAEVKKPKEGA